MTSSRSITMIALAATLAAQISPLHAQQRGKATGARGRGATPAHPLPITPELDPGSPGVGQKPGGAHSSPSSMTVTEDAYPPALPSVRVAFLPSLLPLLSFTLSSIGLAVTAERRS